MENDQGEEKLSANKYFFIFKIAIESKLPRLVEQLLYRIQKLFSYEFLDGNCPDNCKYEEGQTPPAKNGKRPRLLIDAIVETICRCSEDRDNQVQLEVIKVSQRLFNIILCLAVLDATLDHDSRQLQGARENADGGLQDAVLHPPGNQLPGE